jgi:hypothetical protein
MSISFQVCILKRVPTCFALQFCKKMNAVTEKAISKTKNRKRVLEFKCGQNGGIQSLCMLECQSTRSHLKIPVREVSPLLPRVGEGVGELLRSISSTFYKQLLRQWIYTDLSGAHHRACHVKVERNFHLNVLVKLGTVLLVK